MAHSFAKTSKTKTKADTSPRSQGGPGSARKDKSPTKTDRLIAMLMTETGASVAEISAAFGWLPHSTRAALTGLRNGGHRVERLKAPGEASRYRIRQAGDEAPS